MRILASFLDRIRLLGLAKGATAAAEVTVSTIDADHNALDVKAQGTTATSNAILDVATGIANNATVPSRAVQTGGISSDTEPALVSAGRLAFSWVRRNGALMIGALGRNATAIASATNGVPVYPEDASEWPVVGDAGAAVATAANQDLILTEISAAQGAPGDVPPTQVSFVGGIGKDAAPTSVDDGDGVRLWLTRAGAAIVGALGVNGTSIATGANPVPMQLSDGAAVIPIGQAGTAASLPVAQAKAVGATLATVATTGEVIKATGGAIYWCSFTQSTGSTVYVQVHDLAAGPVSAGRRPEWVSSGTFVSGTSSQSLPIGHTTEGAVCNDGIVFVFSTTQYTFTAPAGNTATVRVIYR